VTERSVNHATFVIERTYPAQPARVFAAWADPAAKDTWMDDGQGNSDGSYYEMEFKVGGHERTGGPDPHGNPFRYDAVYYDIVPDQRIVFNYEMYAGDERMSVSLATVEIVPDAEGTRLTYTEQGAFLDGIDTPEGRQGGTEWLLDNLGKYLAGQTAS
jgi:uncharacterized protein YndB with AHSA1/START domain